MKNSEAVMEHLKEGTPAIALRNVTCIFQDVANYNEVEERLVELIFLLQQQIWISWQYELQVHDVRFICNLNVMQPTNFPHSGGAIVEISLTVI